MDFCDEKYNDFPECHWHLWLWRTIPIVQLVFGSLGNIMNIIILSRKRLQQFSTTVYLIFLAFADFCALWTSIFPGFASHGFGKDLRASSQFMCKMTDWIGFTSAGFSIWLLVLLTMERMILTRCPVSSRLKLTRRTAFITAIVCLLILTGLFAHIPFGFEIKLLPTDNSNKTVNQRQCAPVNTKYEEFHNTSLLVFSFLFILVPMILILMSNGVIIVTIIQQRKRFCKVDSVGRAQNVNKYNKTKTSTKMILLISAFFLFTTLPYVFSKVFDSAVLPVTNKDLARRTLSDSVWTFVIHCNYTFNFLLYCVSGTLFNEELRAFVKETKETIYKLFTNVVVANRHDINATRTLPSSNIVLYSRDF